MPQKMKEKITERMKKRRIWLDGGFGTMLQQRGLGSGETTESWNLSHPEDVTAVHRAYLNAGCDVINANTFGINSLKYENYQELLRAGLRCAQEACRDFPECYIALDVGPTGRLLEPLGDLSFDRAVSAFADLFRALPELAAEGLCPDLILIETMNDAYETKAAVLAAKEHSDLPIFVTNVYDESGKLMTGADPEAMIAMLEGLGVSALGMNCSLGPDKMLPLMDIFSRRASVPVIAKPNAGLPEVRDGKTVFAMNQDDFAGYSEQLARKGASILGGCCGSTPDYLREVIARTKEIPLPVLSDKNITVVSSYSHAVTVDRSPVLIGERINPTGKPKLKEALRAGDMSYILGEGIRQADSGAHILDVNVGLPEIDEAAVMKKVIQELQAVTDLPLQIDTSDPAALEGAMRVYNGKPLVNSVNGNEDSMRQVFPLVKKYGGTVIALTLDENGIPETAEGRVAIARRIIDRAAEYGILAKDIIVDPLALTVSSDSESANITLATIKELTRLGIKTSLGVSNISFGLPQREIINSVFFANALECGLSCAIMNPFSKGMTDVYYAFRALKGLDSACSDYIAYASALPVLETVSSIVKAPAAEEKEQDTLAHFILKGLVAKAKEKADALLQTEAPLDVINRHIIPALNTIGADFEAGKAYLPQLLMSADAASAAFSSVKEKIPPAQQSSGKGVILATVKGDIHDIGKNIVHVLLESFGFTVYDLGRDVPPAAVAEAVKKYACRLVGLSALMTTTVPAMEETIRLVREADPLVKTIVGGAVLTQEYADMIGADCYAKDAMETVRYAEAFYGDETEE